MEQKLEHQTQHSKQDEERTARREFLKKAGKAAATAPAVALLLSAQATPASAWGRYGKRAHYEGKDWEAWLQRWKYSGKRHGHSHEHGRKSQYQGRGHHH
jgi:hypothetical protein